MTDYPENWQNYPYLVEWVESANKWAREYEIYEFMPADDQGLDPSGQFSPTDYYPMLPKFTTQQTGRFDNEGSLVWTLVDSDERYVQSDFRIGGDDTIGWFLGRIPHYGRTFPVRYLNEVCITCEGQGSFLFLDQMKKWAAWFVKTDQYTLSLSTPQVASIRSVVKRESGL